MRESEELLKIEELRKRMESIRNGGVQPLAGDLLAETYERDTTCEQPGDPIIMMPTPGGDVSPVPQLAETASVEEPVSARWNEAAMVADTFSAPGFLSGEVLEEAVEVEEPATEIVEPVAESRVEPQPAPVKKSGRLTRKQIIAVAIGLVGGCGIVYSLFEDWQAELKDPKAHVSVMTMPSKPSAPAGLAPQAALEPPADLLAKKPVPAEPVPAPKEAAPAKPAVPPVQPKEVVVASKPVKPSKQVVAPVQAAVPQNMKKDKPAVVVAKPVTAKVAKPAPEVTKVPVQPTPKKKQADVSVAPVAPEQESASETPGDLLDHLKQARGLTYGK